MLKQQIIATLLRRNRPDLANVVAYDEDHHNGTSVGLFIPLPRELAAQRPSLGDDDSSPAHCTVMYVGDCKDAGPLIASTRRVLAGTRPFRVGLSEAVSYFEPNENNGQRSVAKLEVLDRRGRGLHQLRAQLWAAFERDGVEFSDSFPKYEPHVTLGYLEPGTKYDGERPRGQWMVGSVALWGFKRDLTLPFGVKAPV